MRLLDSLVLSQIDLRVERKALANDAHCDDDLKPDVNHKVAIDPEV